MNRPGPGPQPMRPLPGNVYTNPQSSGNRGLLPSSGRLQNGKLGGGGNNAGWGFGMPMGGATGLPSAPSRTNFAQTLGGNQSQASLDLSEFPSLGGASQAQQPNSSSQIWGANPMNLRLTQHTPVQRSQGQNPPSNLQQGQQHESTQHDEMSSSGQFRGSGEDPRFGGQGNLGQIPGASQPQTGNIEEFPPLGGANGDVAQDRRVGGMAQDANFGSFSSPLPNLGQSRNSPSDSQPERAIGSTIGDRSIAGSASTRSHLDDRNGGQRTVQNLGSGAFGGQQGSQLPFRNTGYREPLQQQPLGAIGARSQPSQLEQGFGQDLSGQDSQNGRKRLADMSENERFGVPGLLSMIQPGGPDTSTLALGQDLTVLGLDLNRPDNSPLHPTFGSPFTDASRPVIPNFTLPAAYTVTNVPPLQTKMASFSPETLLAIFYQYPRDIMQEYAASELYNRDWRWHKVLRQWMMKDPELPQPMRLSDKQERGWYIFFDVTHWRRERREFELNYDHLDQRHAQQSAPQGPQ